MSTAQLLTARLELRPIPRRAASALPDGRSEAGSALDARLDAEWPDANLLGVLRRHAEAAPGSECYGVWVMIERESRTVIGDIGFHGPPDSDGTIEIGYSVTPGHRRRGYATEAATALVAWAVGDPGIRMIVAGCDPHNEPSIRILERVGFHRTGKARGEIRWVYGQPSRSAGA